MANWVSEKPTKQPKQEKWVSETGEISIYSPEKTTTNPLLQTPAMKVWKGDISLQQGINEAKKQEELRTTIPSRTYDEGYVQEVKLRDEMKKAEQNLEDAKANDNRNLLEKVLQFRSSIDPIFNAEKDYNKAKKDYEDYKAVQFYSSIPNGEAKTTNPNNKRDIHQGDKTVDWLHEYINNFNDYRKTYIAKDYKDTYDKYAFMNDREIGIYNYLYNTDVDKAKEFLGFLDDDLTQRLKQKNLEAIYDFTGKNAGTATFSSAMSVPISILSSAEQVANSLNYFATGEMKENYASKFASTMRGAVTDKYDVEINGWDAFDFVYNSTMSGIDSATAATMGNWGAVALGLSAAANTTNDIISRGGTSEQAFWGGVAAGTFEGFFEKFSIGQLNAMKDSVGSGFKTYASNMVKSMITNASEETATEVANILYDYAMNEGISQYAMLVDEYMQKNPNADEKEARNYAAKQLGVQIIEALASGALMGFGFGAAGSVYSHKNANSIGKIIAANGMENQVIDLALKTDKNSTAYKIAEKISNSGNMNSTQIGNLAVETMSELSEAKTNVISSAVYNRIIDLGVNESKASSIKENIASALNKKDVKQSTIDSLKSEPAIKQIITETQSPENNPWVVEMSEELEVVENAISQIEKATTFSQSTSTQANTEGQETQPLQNGDEGVVAPVEEGVESTVSPQNERAIGFTEPDAKTIYREPTVQENDEAMFGKRKTAKQRHIIDVAKTLDSDLKVVFVPKNSNVLNGKNGKFVFDSKTMYLAEDLETVEAYAEVFKHEFVHRLELKKAYDSFKRYLFDKSVAFGRYAQTRMEYRDGIKRSREDAINDLVNMYLDNVKGDNTISQKVRDNFTVEKAEREAVADFIARSLFKGNTADLRIALSGNFKNLVNTETDLELFEEMARDDRNLLQKVIDAIRDFINSIKGVPQFKDLKADLQYIEERLTRVYNSADMINGRSNVDNEVFDIVALENGNTYVKASRNIITGTTIKQQRAQITNFFKKLLKNKPSIDIHTIEGDVLTLTMDDTADKARDNYNVVDGNRVKLSSDEFAVKLRIMSHIDEIAETSIKSNKPLSKDEKNHNFAKDGFEYRTAYFEDFDGKYYKIRFSIGHNGTVATVYNVGKIKEDVPSSAKLIAVVGSQALDGPSSTDIIRNENENVNKNSSDESYSSDNLDTDYLKAVKNNDMETAQRLVDEAAKENGYSVKAYHGTSSGGFTVFDTYGGNFGLFGKGAYFTENKQVADSYQEKGKGTNKQTYSVFLSPKKMLDMDANANIEAWKNAAPEASDYFENCVTNEDCFRELKEYCYDEEMIRWEAEEYITDVIQYNMGYNSITHIGGGRFNKKDDTRHRVYIVFDSEQIKSADPVTYDDNGNVIPLSERFKDTEIDIRYSSDDIISRQEDLLNRYENGEITKEEYLNESSKNWVDANEEYGSLPKGENANADISVPKAVAKDKPTERFIRTIIETDSLKEDALSQMGEKVLLGDFSYDVMSDENAIKTANKSIENGTADSIWEDAVNVGKHISKNQVAIGEKLLANAIKENDTFKILKLSSELADIFTRAGQVVQAARLLKKMTGAGRLISAQRFVKTLNTDLIKKYGESVTPIRISEESAKRLVGAKTEGEIEQAFDEIMDDVAGQMPVTFMDKWNAWRCFAMLSNPKTHIRNIVGNAIFTPAVRIKDAIAFGTESVFLKDKSKKTKSLIIQKEYSDFAKKDSSREEVIQLLKGNKYNDKTAVREKQKVFKTEALNFLTEFNSNALEFEDMLFKNKHYTHALAGYLQSRKINLKSISEETLAEARIYAVEEAKKATFNDESALANAVQRFANKNLVANLLVEGVLPFKRTPINIVKRGVEYSPLGLAKTLTKGVYDVKKGKITPTEYIDGLASGLTGTGIMLVGMFLANLGCVSGGEKDDDESKFEKLLGKQEYAVEFLGKSYTIDWAAPACIPFFIGVEIVNTINEGEEFTLSQFGNAVWNSLEPITNLSMISGIQGVIESARYADSSQIISAIVTDALTSYSMQGVPSLLGATARTIDPTQRSWYIDKNDKWLDSTAQTIKNNIQSKIPGLSYTQVPKIDMWGREVSRGGIGERILENFVSPGYYSEIEYNETSEELKKIFNKTDVDVFPNTAAKSFEVNGETKHLTADEYVTYAKAKGEYSFEYITEFIESSAYKKLDDQERADVIVNLYKYANAKAKTTVSEYDITKQFKTVNNWEQNGSSAIDYYVYKAITK